VRLRAQRTIEDQLTDLAGKRVELLRQVVPGLRRLAIMVYPSPLGDQELGEVQIAAGKLGLELVTLKIRRMEVGPTAPRGP
jgi:putative tryptophan/tyrosine transport system substrate-binding protein